MKHFKHLKPGMSLLEVMAAIGILAIFGSSIFFMQQFLCNHIMIAQQKLSANLRMQSELTAYEKNILEEFFEQKGPVEKSLQEQSKSFKQPNMTIKIITKSDLGAKQTEDKDSAGSESLFKQLKNLYLLDVQAECIPDFVQGSAGQGKIALDTTKNCGSSYHFVYIPEVAKK